nr:hypothetical protein CFP56_08812 [Quercus suber]
MAILRLKVLEPLLSMSNVYALVLQEESHKGIGHGSAFTPKLDSVTMYANTKGNSGSKGGAISSMLSRAFAVPVAAGVSFTSILPSDSINSSFLDTMSDPFVPSTVEASCSAGIDGFVTPISIPNFASLDFDVVPSSPTIVPPSSPPVASVPPLPFRKSTRDIKRPAYL